MEINQLAEEERPREKLLQYGSSYLNDTELIAIILGSGIKGKGIMQLAREIVRIIDRSGDSLDIRTLMDVNGLGIAKASLIMAALEFSRRRFQPSLKRIHLPSDVLPTLAHYADRTQEHFICISLNGAYEILQERVVSIGLVNRTMVHPREVFSDPIKDRATAIICAHNHPSGNTEPSQEDRDVTKMLRQAGKVLGIELLDHIIFSQKGYYSFAENNELV